MEIDQIRELIADSMGTDCDEQWGTVLNNTDPGHYGVEDIEFQIDIEDIWVNIPRRTFTFKNGMLSFNARLYGNRDEDGFDRHVDVTISGHGTFSWGGTNGIVVEYVSVNGTISIFAGAPD